MSSNLVPGPDDFWFLPLGGTGEIGMNMNLYGHNGHWLMVDCGVTFQEPLHSGSKTLHDLVAADPSFVEANRDKLVGIVITHAHEDHVGAMPYLWSRFKAPVYTTPFTAEVLRRKVRRDGNGMQGPIIEMSSGDRQIIGNFEVEWLATTHSIPEPHGLVIRTGVGSVFHTADWKIDPNPIISKGFNPAPLKHLADEQILAVVGDSTNATKAGMSVSEAECYDGLLAAVSGIEGRVVVSCFSSNIARLITLARIAVETGRYFTVLGRSLQNMVQVAKLCGYWPEPLVVQDERHIGFLPPREVLAVATGSQGEPRAAMTRLAQDRHPSLALDVDDGVIFSAMVIPGNEKPIEKLVQRFEARGVKVVQSAGAQPPIHASGHPNQQELEKLYQWVQPKMAIPVHGENDHLVAHAQVAKQQGVRHAHIGQNGDLFLLAPISGIQRQRVDTGRIALSQT